MRLADHKRCVILITGGSKDDRLAFLRTLHHVLRRRRGTAGFISETELLTPENETVSPDICFLGEIGASLPKGKGFRTPRFSRCQAVVFGIDRQALPAVVDAIAMDEPVTVDLDAMTVKQGLRSVTQRLSRMDAERIGAAAGLIGLMEAGLGSALHIYQVPLKGHVLSSLENLMLICFGKPLRGRGLIRIAFISAMLKAFSPMGARIRPMLYIFFQGAAFALPIHLLGWHVGSVLIGSLMLGWITLGISLLVDYLTFGVSVFHAFEGAAGALFQGLGAPSPSLTSLIVLAFGIRSAASLGVGAFAYFGDPSPILRRLVAKRRIGARRSSDARRSSSSDRGNISTALRALRDMTKARFLLGFLVSILLMRFFTELSRTALINVILRGIVISYLGFLLTRRLNVRAIGVRLDRIFRMNLEESLPAALAMVDGTRQPTDDGDIHASRNTASVVKSRSQNNIEATRPTVALQRTQKG